MPLSRDEGNRLMGALKAALPTTDVGKLKSCVAPFVQTTVGQVVSATQPKQTHNPDDPTVKVLPKNHKGPDYRGRRYSQTDPLFLAQLAHMLDSFADKSEGDSDPQKQRYAKWDRENAIKAREWRTKLEGKASPQIVLPSVESLADEGVL